MSKADTTPSFLARLFDPRGRIAPGQFWASMAISLLLLPLAAICAAMASDPRGSDSPLLLAVPLLFAFLWLFAVAIVKRVRDAGRPLWFAFIVMAALIALPVLGLALFWDIWPVFMLVALGLLALVSHLGQSDRIESSLHDAR